MSLFGKAEGGLLGVQAAHCIVGLVLQVGARFTIVK